MLRFLNLPILFPVLMGLGLLILHPGEPKTRNLYLMTAVLITSALSLSPPSASPMSRAARRPGLHHHGPVQRRVFHLLRIDGASMVFGDHSSSTLWPIITVYAIDYMSHEGSEKPVLFLLAHGLRRGAGRGLLGGLFVPLPVLMSF